MFYNDPIMIKVIAFLLKTKVHNTISIGKSYLQYYGVHIHENKNICYRS